MSRRIRKHARLILGVRMNESISRVFSLFRQGFAFALLSASVAACGSSGSDQHSRVGASDNAGDVAGRSNGGSAGNNAAGAGAASGGGAASANQAGNSGTGGSGGVGDRSDQGPEPGYCPGESAVGTPCVSDADCSGFTPLCREKPYTGSGVGPVCNPPTMAPCTDDASCGSGICVSSPSAASCPPVRACVPACTATSCGADDECASNGHCVPKACPTNWSCPADYRCAAAGATGADIHGCQPVPCTEGYTCANGYSCSAAASAPKDVHGCAVIQCSQPGALACPTNSDCVPSSLPGSGCVVRRCTTSSDCECGTCIGGMCANRPWMCVQLPPV